MSKAAKSIHPIYPHVLTIFVAIAFFIFGLYCLSADGKFRKLLFMKPVFFIIAGIYLLRGIGELIFDMDWKKQINFWK